MKKNWKPILILSVVMILLIASGIYSVLSERVPYNDISVTGNTAGNLNNGGLFAESGGRVYFANAYDGGRMYSMNTDETDLVRLGDSRVSSINVGGNYLYYYMDSAGGGTGLGFVVRTYGVYRSRLDGSNPEVVAEGNYENIQLTSSYAYFNAFGQEIPVYHTPLNGPINVTTFSAASDAAFAQSDK